MSLGTNPSSCSHLNLVLVLVISLLYCSWILPVVYLPSVLSPCGANGKEPACQCRKHKRGRFDPWIGKNPLKEEMVTHSSILAWRIPWAAEHSGLQSVGSWRVGQNQSGLARTRFTFEASVLSPCPVYSLQYIFVLVTVLSFPFLKGLTCPSKS